MKKPLKIILSIVAGVVLLVVLVVCSVLVFFNLNNYKPEIITAVKHKTGRDLLIDGDLKLSFFPLGMATGKMTLSNAQGFSEKQFASLEESHIGVEFVPLLSKKVQVSSIALKGLTLNLAKNQQGATNWADLTVLKTPANAPVGAPSTQKIATAATAGTVAVLSKFSIGAVTLADAKINWQDLQTGRHLAFNDLTMNANKVDFNQPVTVDWAFVMVNAQTKVSQTVKLNTVLTVNEKLDTFVLNHGDLQLITAGDSIPNKSITSSLIITDGTVSLTEKTFKVSKLQLKSGDLILTANLSGEHFNEDTAIVQGTVKLAPFSPAKLMKEFAIPAPHDVNIPNKLAMDFNIQASQHSLDLQNLVVNIDDTVIKGSTSINNFANPAIVFNLAVDTLDVNRYFILANKSKKPINPMISLAAGVSALPVETLRKLNVNGDLTVGTLNVNAMNLQDVHFHISAKEGVVKTTQMIKQFYQGEYASKLTMDVRNTPASLVTEQTFTHVQVEPLLTALQHKPALRGTLDATLQLKGRGNTHAELQSSLNGQLTFLCKDGAVIGFSVQKMLDKAKALVKGTDLVVNHAREETPFLVMSGTANLNKGLISNDDLQLTTKKVDATGKGTANIITEQLDYKLSALLPKELIANVETDLFHNAPIVIAIGGTFSKPIYSVDVSVLLTEQAKTKAANLMNKLNTEENKAKLEHALDKLKPEEKEKLKKLSPKLGKLFKKLF